MVRPSKCGIKYRKKYRTLGIDTGMGIRTTSIMKHRPTIVKGKGKDDEEIFMNVEEPLSAPMTRIDQCYRSGRLAPARTTLSHPGGNRLASSAVLTSSFVSHSLSSTSLRLKRSAVEGSRWASQHRGAERMYALGPRSGWVALIDGVGMALVRGVIEG